MTTWALLAPGPSASRALAERVAHLPIGAIGCAYQLVDTPAFIAASDKAWWRKYPDAAERDCPRYSMAVTKAAEQISLPHLGAVCNSGVLGLEVAKRAGATRILLLGFDMHGSHFFGQYVNGLRNTKPHQREQHKRQFSDWGRLNRPVQVLNCTKGSALTCFPMARLDDCLAELAA
jgi:hypothetical protein